MAILSVMLFHFFQSSPAPAGHLLRGLGKIMVLGQSGVDLFFILSGFLITGILLSWRGRPRALSTFYWRRTLRIFPLYYSYLLGAFLLLPLVGWAPRIGWSDQWWFWVYAQNVQDTFVSGFHMFGPGHFWSLAVEEHFYLFWPFIVLWLPEKRLAAVLVSIAGLALASRAFLVWCGYPVFFFTACRMDAIALGALVALAARDQNLLSNLGRGIRRWGIWACLGVLPFYGMFSGAANPAVQVFKFTLISLVCAAILVLALTARPGGLLAQMLGCGPARVIAKGSYALYVFHPAIFEACLPLQMHLPFVACLSIAFGLTGVAAFLSWHLLEAPFLRLRDSRKGAKRMPFGYATESPAALEDLNRPHAA